MSVDELLEKAIRIEYLQPMTVLSSGYEGCDHTDPRFAEFVRDAVAMGVMAEPGMRRDFFFRNDSIEGYEFVLAVPDDFSATPPHVVKAFPGGLYAIVSCTDDIPQKVDLLLKSIDACESFTADAAEDPFRNASLSHVITPKSTQDALGVQQMDLFLPIRANTG